MAKPVARRDSVAGLQHDTRRSLTAQIDFLKHDPAHEQEEAYALRYRPTEDDVPLTNMSFEPQEVSICDLRGQEDNLSLCSCGFEIRKLRSSVTYEQFENESAVKQSYLRDMERQLKEDFGAIAVDFLRFRIRRRHPEFPTSTGQSFTHDQPSTAAHIDINQDSAPERIRECRGGDAEAFLNRPYQVINIWKPLRGPLQDWPLAICDVGSVDRGRDLTQAFICHPEYVNSNCQIHFSSTQQWYYLRNQEADELLIFRQFDSRLEGNNGVPHSSFEDPTTPKDAPYRESVEVMAIVYLE